MVNIATHKFSFAPYESMAKFNTTEMKQNFYVSSKSKVFEIKVKKKSFLRTKRFEKPIKAEDFKSCYLKQKILLPFP